MKKAITIVLISLTFWVVYLQVDRCYDLAKPYLSNLSSYEDLAERIERKLFSTTAVHEKELSTLLKMDTLNLENQTTDQKRLESR